MGVSELGDWGHTVVKVEFVETIGRDLFDENEVDTGEQPDAVPLARLGFQDIGDVSALLVVNGEDATSPVWLWDEGQFTSIAPSLEVFLGKLTLP